MKKILSVVIIFCLCQTGHAGKQNLISNDRSLEIVVEKEVHNGTDYFRFLLINNKIAKGECVADGSICHRRDIGMGQMYTKEDLHEMMNSERTEAYVKSVIGGVGAAALAVGLAFAGMYTGIALVIGSGGGTAVPYILATVGAAGGLSMPTWFDKLNPWTQFEQANLLKNYDILEKDVFVPKEEVEKVAKMLENVFEANL